MSGTKYTEDQNGALLERLRRKEEELEENNSLLASLLENTSSSLMVLKALRDKRNKISDFEYQYTYTETATPENAHVLIGKRFREQVLGTLPPGLFETFREVVETGNNWHGEVYMDSDDNGTWAQVLVKKFEDGVVVIYTDINEKKKAEYELVELRLKQQREVLNAIILAQEEERERIGEALHDGVAQLLYGAQTRLQAMNPVPAEDQKNIKEILAIISDAINDTRRISFELVPAVLKDYGIEVALKTLFQRIIKDTPKISLQVKGLAKRLPEKMEYTIYRIVQELVNNILKHSKATEASVDIRFSRKVLNLTIADNGIGIREHAEERISKGIGLQNIKNRVKLMEGSFKIQSSSSSGTAIFISMPVK
jgi:signal transduction histidine kinase